jgi:hypothetical protein
LELLAPISAGELLDKITILEIKSERIANQAKLENVLRELDVLTKIATREELFGVDVHALLNELRDVNQALWDVEDALRDLERTKDFGVRFVELARSVYRHNDRRAEIKRAINLQLGSTLIEEKSYSPQA